MGERVRGIDARPQYPRQNALAKALREIGRLERTLFTLGWISDPTLRRRAKAGLNKGEARNALARRVLPSPRLLPIVGDDAQVDRPSDHGGAFSSHAATLRRILSESLLLRA